MKNQVVRDAYSTGPVADAYNTTSGVHLTRLQPSSASVSQTTNDGLWVAFGLGVAVLVVIVVRGIYRWFRPRRSW